MQPRSRVNKVVLTTERYLEGISKLDKGMSKEANNVSNPTSRGLTIITLTSRSSLQMQTTTGIVKTGAGTDKQLRTPILFRVKYFEDMSKLNIRMLEKANVVANP